MHVDLDRGSHPRSSRPHPAPSPPPTAMWSTAPFAYEVQTTSPDLLSGCYVGIVLLKPEDGVSYMVSDFPSDISAGSTISFTVVYSVSADPSLVAHNSRFAVNAV